MRRRLCVLLGVLLVPTVGLVGDVVTDGKFKSTMSTGAPLEVASDDMVLNLNADMVDGLEASDFASAIDTYTKAEADALVASAVESARTKRYFLTDAYYPPTSVESACGSGYHMANLFEISQPSSMHYAFDDGRAVHNSIIGQGPPTGYRGWIKTGWDSPSTVNTPGFANCNNWSSVDAGHYGTAARLPPIYSDPVSTVWALVWGTPWATLAQPCNTNHRVWCVED